MACGVHLGILLICLVQAEHVRCLWAAQAQSSQRQNSNAYVGFSQQQSGQGRLASNYPQNQLRLASAQSSSSSSSQGLSSRGYTYPHSQPAQSGYSSVMLAQSSSLSKPNWRPAKSNQVNAQTVPKRSFGLSPAIASGSSVSKYHKKQNTFTDVSKKRTWPVKQGTAHVSSSSASVQSPRSISTAQKAPSAAATSASYGPRSYAPVKSSSRFSAGAPALQEAPVQMQTSATGRARKVSSSRRSSKASKPSRFSTPQNERSLNNPGQTDAGNRYQSKLFQPTGGSTQASYKPTSTSSIGSSHVSYSHSLPAHQTQNAVNFHPRSLEKPTSQRSSSASGSSRTGASGQRFAPTRTYDIPDRFGGFAIRRLKEPADQEVSVRKPQQQSYPASSWQSASVKPQQQAYSAPSQQQSYPTSSWQSAPLKPQQQAYSAPSQQQAYSAPSQQQAYSAPSQQQAYSAPSQQQAYSAPSQQQAYSAPSQQQAYSAPSQQQAYSAPSQQQAYSAPSQQQAYSAPSQQQASSYKPQVQSVHPESKWKRFRPSGKLSAAGVTG